MHVDILELATVQQCLHLKVESLILAGQRAMVGLVLRQELLKEVGETAGVSAIPTRIALYTTVYRREKGNTMYMQQ